LRKLKLEKITGAVALTYLVLIPAGAFYAWKKIQEIEDNVSDIWVKTGMEPVERPPIFDIMYMKKRLFG
jgi:hypothetical protein